jgi:alkaline phosphatase D
MSHTQRRQFIVKLASLSAVIGSGAALSACGGGDDPVRFDFGVASGDPLADRVILWTHAKHGDLQATSGPVTLSWEVARDAAFSQLVASGSVVSEAASGHTAKVDATGLTAGQAYFYRFRSGASISPVGQTRTLPAAGATDLRLAVFSCANYPAGYFHAYGEALKVQAQFALHLGDYIYEYPAGGYASETAAAMGRVSVPANECVTLDDYRRRYAQYRSDPDLKQLHAGLPMIAIWDDHEVANDSYKDGAENHTEGAEGRFSDRVAAALKAYHEWMPLRPRGSDLRQAYRSFDFGGLVALHVLETRLNGRDRQVTFEELLNPGTASQALATLASPTRQLLGTTQLQWLQGQMAASTATWQVLGQQVLMGEMAFPVSILAALNSSDTSAQAQQAAQQAITDYLTAKATAAQAPQALTPAQQALLNPALNPRLGYNLDAWDGYPAARETVLGTAQALGKRLVVLAGDTHNAWHSELRRLDRSLAGHEFATPGVSSPGLEAYLATLPPAQVAQIFRGVIDTLKYADTSRRGFLLMRFTPQQASGTWYLLDTVKARSYTVTAAHTASVAA